MGTPKINFPLFFTPNRQEMLDCPMPSNALPQREASLLSTVTEIVPPPQMYPLFPGGRTRPRGLPSWAFFEFCRLWKAVDGLLGFRW